MKAKIEASCMESRRAVPVLLDAGVHKKTSKKCKASGMEENSEEMREYLGKLQELVPFMPKNKRLSKLEVISNVIDYIHDLRETLGLPPCQQQLAEMDFEDDGNLPDSNLPETPQHSAQVPETNQTFKVAVVPRESESSDSTNLNQSNRLPLSSISSPSNTKNTS